MLPAATYLFTTIRSMTSDGPLICSRIWGVVSPFITTTSTTWIMESRLHPIALQIAPRTTLLSTTITFTIPQTGTIPLTITTTTESTFILRITAVAVEVAGR